VSSVVRARARGVDLTFRSCWFAPCGRVLRSGERRGAGPHSRLGGGGLTPRAGVRRRGGRRLGRGVWPRASDGRGGVWCNGLSGRVVRLGAVDAFFAVDVDEVMDWRNWRDIPEAEDLVRAANAGLRDEALDDAGLLRKRYPDFYFAYLWLADLHTENADYGAARDALQQGFANSKQKRELFSALGKTEWAAGNLTGAVQNWIKCGVIQISAHRLDDYVPFLYLAYVAEELGLTEAHENLLRHVDRIQSGEVRLDAETAHDLGREAATAEDRDVIRRAITVFNAEFLTE
jgi:hypothetical protein